MANRTLLLVVDVQAGLFDKSSRIFGVEALLRILNQMIDHFHAWGDPVVFVRHENQSMLKKDTPGWQIHSDLHRCPSDFVVGKKMGSVFDETELPRLICDEGITHVVVTGLITHGCVKAACRGAKAMGLHTTLIADGHSGFNKRAEALIAEWNEKLAQEGIEVVTAEAYCQRAKERAL